MGKISVTMSVVAAVVAVALSGCGRGVRLPDIEPIGPPKLPGNVEPFRPPEAGRVDLPNVDVPAVPNPPSGEKLAEENLHTLATVNNKGGTDYKKIVIKNACHVYETYEFLNAHSDEDRANMIAAQGESPKALAYKVVGVAKELNELDENPKFENGVKVTASFICAAQDIAG